MPAAPSNWCSHSKLFARRLVKKLFGKRIFTFPDAALRSFAADALRVYCAVLGIFGIQIACQMTFVAIGNAASSILVAVMRKFILLIPLIYIMPQLLQNKTTAVYTAEPVADFLSVTFTVILFTFLVSPLYNKTKQYANKQTWLRSNKTILKRLSVWIDPIRFRLYFLELVL